MDETTLLAIIEALVPEYQQLLQQLIRVPSPAGAEGEAQALVFDHMTKIGLAVERVQIDSEKLAALDSFNRTTARYDGNPCVVGRLRGSGGGKSLLLNAHIDTVPVDAAEPWTHPPFSGAIEAGKIYGRGACDDKAGIVECLLVADALRRSQVSLAGDLIIASVVGDETSGNGSLACVEAGHIADGVIIVDGTWPERFIVSHMGQVSFRIRMIGLPGHATSAGPNPILAIGRVVDGLSAVAAAGNAAQQRPWGPNAAPFFLNLGVVQGGVFPGSVPTECVLEGQFGFPPPWSVDQAKSQLREALQRLANQPDWPLRSAATIEFAGLQTPTEIGERDNAIVRLLTSTVRRRQGAELKESVISGHCDLRHFTKARMGATTAACLYGPGGGRNIHGADEYFELAHLPIVAGNLACVALQWCRESRG